MKNNKDFVKKLFLSVVSILLIVALEGTILLNPFVASATVYSGSGSTIRVQVNPNYYSSDLPAQYYSVAVRINNPPASGALNYRLFNNDTLTEATRYEELTYTTILDSENWPEKDESLGVFLTYKYKYLSHNYEHGLPNEKYLDGEVSYYYSGITDWLARKRAEGDMGIITYGLLPGFYSASGGSLTEEEGEDLIESRLKDFFTAVPQGDGTCGFDYLIFDEPYNNYVAPDGATKTVNDVVAGIVATHTYQEEAELENGCTSITKVAIVEPYVTYLTDIVESLVSEYVSENKAYLDMVMLEDYGGTDYWSVYSDFETGSSRFEELISLVDTYPNCHESGLWVIGINESLSFLSKVDMVILTDVWGTWYPGVVRLRGNKDYSSGLNPQVSEYTGESAPYTSLVNQEFIDLQRMVLRGYSVGYSMYEFLIQPDSDYTLTVELTDGLGTVLDSKVIAIDTTVENDGYMGCVPDCTGKNCGDNGCGGDCGACPQDQLCSHTYSCVTGLYDANSDGEISILDLSMVLGNYGWKKGVESDFEADVNLDGEVSILDVSNILGKWGESR